MLLRNARDSSDLVVYHKNRIMSAAGGLVAAAGSAICNGSFGTISRLRKVERAQIPSPIFSFWTCMGIVVCSIPFLAVTPRVFTPWGLLSGLFFVISMACTFITIQRLGLGSGAGVWSGVAIVVSFTFAVKFQEEKIHQPGLAAPGLMLLVAGVVAIAFNGQAATSYNQREAAANNQLIDADVERSSSEPDSRLQSRLQPDPAGYPLGLLLAVLTGFFGGLVLAPMNYAQEDAKGLQFVPSMALGVLLSAPFVTAGLMGISNSPWSLRVKDAALPGIASGIIWNCGNALSILASRNPDVGLAVAYPIMQAGLFVAGLWGIFLFNELKLVRHQVTYWLGGVVLIVGATMLAVSKQ